MIHYIGIHGPKRVGKDLFAANLSEAIKDADYRSCILIDRLADPLYAWAKEISGWPIHRLMGDEKDLPFTEESVRNRSLIGRTPRSLLLDIGKWVREQYGMDFLGNCLIARAERHLANSASRSLWVFVPDVRCEQEADIMDFVFELSRDGCSYAGGLTEHEFVGVEVRRVHLKTCPDNAARACDFIDLSNELRTHFLKESA